MRDICFFLLRSPASSYFLARRSQVKRKAIDHPCGQAFCKFQQHTSPDINAEMAFSAYDLWLKDLRPAMT